MKHTLYLQDAVIDATIPTGHSKLVVRARIDDAGGRPAHWLRIRVVRCDRLPATEGSESAPVSEPRGRV